MLHLDDTIIRMDAMSVNVAKHLRDAARRYQEKAAIIACRGCVVSQRSPRDRITFRELDHLVDAYVGGLSRIGIRRGTRTILMVRPGIDFFALTYALLRMGAVTVLIDPGMGRRRMASCLGEIEAEAFIGIPQAQLFRVLNRRAFQYIKTIVTVGRRWCWGGHRLDSCMGSNGSNPHPSPLPKREREPEAAPRAAVVAKPQAAEKSEFAAASTTDDDPAAILFTTGSTGPPKGVLYTHGMFNAQIRLLRDHFGFGPDDVDLPTFPLFALFDAALGITAVIPDMDFTRPGHVDPRRIIGPIQDMGIGQMFGSPALLDRVGRYGMEHGVKLPKLKRVLTAGAPASPAVLERFASMLSPDAAIHTPYGATEALPVASITHHEILRETAATNTPPIPPLSGGAVQADRGGTCVGRPVREMSVRVIRIDDKPIHDWSEESVQARCLHHNGSDSALPADELVQAGRPQHNGSNLVLPAGEIGEIVVKGPVVTREYYRKPEATALAKILDADGGVWHRMGDVGYIDVTGRLWFCGRKAHRVTTAEGVLFTIPCEAIFNQHPKVRRTALVGVGPAGRQRPVLCVELERGTPRRKRERIRDELLVMGAGNPLTRSIRTILFHRRFPVDIRHNAKIFREKLAVWATRQSFRGHKPG